MGKRCSAAAISKDQLAAHSQAIRSLNPCGPPQWPGVPVEAPFRRHRPWLWISILILGIFLLGGLAFGGVLLWDANSHYVFSRTICPQPNTWSKAPSGPEQSLCVEFARRQNAGDLTAADLLGPPPIIPTDPVSQEEADRLQASLFLRQPIRIVGVGFGDHAATLTMYTKGNVSAPRIQVRTAEGVETVQRTMSNPDLIIEVRDGHIHGVAATLHTGS